MKNKVHVIDASVYVPLIMILRSKLRKIMLRHRLHTGSDTI